MAAFGSTRRPGIAPGSDPNLQALVDAGAPVATIFGKSWDFHVTEALETTLEENLAMITDSVGFLLRRFEEVIYDAEHFFDGFKRNREYALRTLRAAEEGAPTSWFCAIPTEVRSRMRSPRSSARSSGM